MFNRYLNDNLNEYLKYSKNILLLGPRQTGKSTLVETLLKTVKKKQLIFKLQDAATFEEIIKSPRIITEKVEANLEDFSSVILFIDEIQKIPTLLDSCQYLIDTYKSKLTVILTGSSARKLRTKSVNLLPGRIMVEHLHSLIIPEIKETEYQRLVPIKIKNTQEQSKITLDEMLLYGTLPGILGEKRFRSKILSSYVSTYLQEEIRQEALTRNLGNFSKFLELAGLGSGSVLNFTHISSETGIPLNTIKNYFQILEDTLISFPIPPFTKKTKKQILATPKYIFFDVGVRNTICGIPDNPSILKTEIGGKIFEHFITLELIKRIKYKYPNWKYYFWRTNTGLEVDFIIQTEDEIIPIEIKYTTTPKEKHIKHLQIFMEEYNCKRGFLVGVFNDVRKLTKNIYALPWDKI